jgi:Mor family transcriptional regulator
MTEPVDGPGVDGGESRDPDLVLVILRMVVQLNPSIDPETVLAIEQEIRANYGGKRYFLPKRKKHPSPAQRRALVQDALSSMATPEIERRHDVDRSTIYRSLKRFAKRGGD